MNTMPYIAAVIIAVIEIIANIDRNQRMAKVFSEDEMKSFRSYNAGMIILISVEVYFFLTDFVF